jgi:hypothetical protein
MPFARKSDPTTSFEAAASVNDITKTQEFILMMLENHAMTDVALVGYFKAVPGPKASESGIRSRRSELVAAGLVIDSGERVKLASGRKAIVWAKA